jgi:hypothetical protein
MRLETILFCRLDGRSFAEREQVRLSALAQSGLLSTTVPAIFQEAIQTASELLGLPISWISVLDQQQFQLKAAIGLNKLGILNDLRTSRCLAREEAFCINVVDSQQVLAIADTREHPAFSLNALTQQYGIRAYLGAPLLTHAGYCVGTLAVLDVEPREFTHQSLQMMAMLARWCMSEYERDQLVEQQSTMLFGSPAWPELVTPRTTPTRMLDTPTAFEEGQRQLLPLRLELIHHLAEDLNNPLAVILGMVAMLEREVYGPLTQKQRLYLERMRGSGYELSNLVNDVLQIAKEFQGATTLNVLPVDVELLCHQVTHSLDGLASMQHTDIRLLLEPGQQLWCLDRDLVRQALYHLLYALIHSNKETKTLKLQVSCRSHVLKLTCWLSYTALQDDLPLGGPGQLTTRTELTQSSMLGSSPSPLATSQTSQLLGSQGSLPSLGEPERYEANVFADLRLQLSQALAALHGGTLQAQTLSDRGVAPALKKQRSYRHILAIPVRKAS